MMYYIRILAVFDREICHAKHVGAQLKNLSVMCVERKRKNMMLTTNVVESIVWRNVRCAKRLRQSVRAK